MPKDSNNLTICTVDYGSRAFLDLNWKLTTCLNDKKDFTWLVVNNRPEGGKREIAYEDERFNVIAGASYESSLAKSQPGSFHHAMGLAKALPHIKTRFALFLDPDFYIVRTQWIEEILSYMQERKLSFFGAPWNPKWFVKWRYFPSPHCLFVDSDKVDVQNLDFRPEEKPTSSQKEQVIKSLLKNLLTLNDRDLIGSDHDTGYRIFHSFCNPAFSDYDCAVPVFIATDAFRPGRDFIGRIKRIELYSSGLNKLIERALPDSLCFIPKKERYYTSVRFRDLGCFDAYSKDWEEFFWKDRPFGFHLRNNPKAMYYDMDNYEKLDSLKEAVDFFISRRANP
jgi:hypothetical protein